MSLYEGGIRVPALVHWPSRLEGSRAESAIATVYDWLPTLLSLAGHPGVADSDLAGDRLVANDRRLNRTATRSTHCPHLSHADRPENGGYRRKMETDPYAASVTGYAR